MARVITCFLSFCVKAARVSVSAPMCRLILDLAAPIYLGCLKYFENIIKMGEGVVYFTLEIHLILSPVNVCIKRKMDLTCFIRYYSGLLILKVKTTSHGVKKHVHRLKSFSFRFFLSLFFIFPIAFSSI